MSLINLFQPYVGEAELAAVERVFSSNWLGAGERVAEFEREFGAYVGRPAHEMLAVSSCSEGLFHAVAALDLGAADDVVLPTISFIGAAHAVRNAGARVVLCDVDPHTLNPTVEDVKRALTPATKAVLLLHYGGAPGDIAQIAELARQRSLRLIEDAAIGLGSAASGQACGTLGNVGVWSFDSMKVLATGDGGMVWCSSEETAERIRTSVRLGVRASGFSQRDRSSRWWEVDPSSMGRRATMNDIAAAIGLAQLERLPEFLRRRDDIATAYDDGLRDVEWLSRPESLREDEARAHTFYSIQTSRGTRDRLAAYLLERGVYTSFRYWPLHRTRMYRDGGCFLGADHAADSTLLLPMHQGLSDDDVDRVLAALQAFTP